MKVVKFITYEEAEPYEENGVGGFGGMFHEGMRWADYIERFTDMAKPIVENLRSAIIENKIRCTGDEHQHTDIKSVAVFEDNTVATYSYRGWGDLMAAIWSTEEDKDYDYMDFYM